MRVSTGRSLERTLRLASLSARPRVPPRLTMQGLPNKVLAAEYRTMLPDEKRSVRRCRQRVAKARRVRILLRHGAWTPAGYWQPKIWRPLCRLVMSEPGWWVHERV